MLNYENCIFFFIIAVSPLIKKKKKKGNLFKVEKQ